MNKTNNSNEQSQNLGSMSQKQSQGSSGQSQNGREVPDGQASYGNSQDESGQSEQDVKDATDKGTASANATAIPGAISRRPDEQARADANPTLYEG